MSPELQALVASALLASGLTVLELGEDSAVVRLPEGAEHTIGFSNLLRTLALADASERQRVLERYVAGWLEQARRAELDLPREGEADRLFPRLLGPDEAGTRLWDPLESTCRHASLSIL